MIDLGDQTVDVVRSRRGDKEVGPAGVVEERERTVRRGPRIPRQQTRDDGICWTTERGDLSRIGNTRGRVQSDSFALAFVSEIEERAIAHDWTTERAAKLVVAKLSLRVGFGVEEVARVEFVVAEKFKQ